MIIEVHIPPRLTITVMQHAIAVVEVQVPGIQGRDGAASFPAGGAAGNALTKKSSTDGDVGWGIPTPIDGGTFN
jgi:hypothetical protein